MTQIVNALSDISAQYDALFVDLWGCVHNGVRAFDAANKALIEYRAGGGIVVLVTNSPRPRAQVEQQLADFGVARDAWDSIASSGDSARSALFLGISPCLGLSMNWMSTDSVTSRVIAPLLFLLNKNRLNSFSCFTNWFLLLWRWIFFS